MEQEQKSHIKVWHHVGAFLVGYLAAGFTYAAVPFALAYPTGALRGATGSDFFSFELVKGIASVAAVVVLQLGT